jgi:hypothetical protein
MTRSHHGASMTVWFPFSFEDCWFATSAFFFHVILSFSSWEGLSNSFWLLALEHHV